MLEKVGGTSTLVQVQGEPTLPPAPTPPPSPTPTPPGPPAKPATIEVQSTERDTQVRWDTTLQGGFAGPRGSGQMVTTASPVDANGCSQSQVDADLDGVCDPGKTSTLCVGSDNCPGTPSGTPVDANGCSTTQNIDSAQTDLGQASALVPPNAVGGITNQISQALTKLNDAENNLATNICKSAQKLQDAITQLQGTVTLVNNQRCSATNSPKCIPDATANSIIAELQVAISAASTARSQILAANPQC